MNPIGLAAGATAFLSIWLGHVSVRKIESAAPALALPSAALASAGVLLEWFSSQSTDPVIAAAAGILGITLLWDAVELWRQQNRVRKGHAPANPANPRHARLLAEAGTRATTDDLLKREPRGHPVALEVAAQRVPPTAGAAPSTRAQGS